MKEEQFTQILRAINDVRDDVKEFKNEMNRRWDENDKRWAENDKKWKENQKELEKIHEKIEQRYKDTRRIFDAYENSVENMYQENKQKITQIQKTLKIVNA